MRFEDRLSESDLLRHVTGLARSLGWKVHHTVNSRKSPPGFPDLVMVKGKRLLFVELKSERGRLSEAQVGWLKVLAKAGAVDVRVWRPKDVAEIDECLSRR